VQAPDIDAAFVCTPNHLIPKLCIDAPSAGKHVFAEKPPGFNARQVAAVSEAERAAGGRKLMHGFNHRYHQSIIRITAFGNDYGYEQWVARALGAYADPGDVVVLISSSGSSPNIVNAARYARDHDSGCVIFSGFAPNNPLRGLGASNLWVDCNAYNVVESVHLIWILLVVNLLESDDADDDFVDRSLATITELMAAPGRHCPLIAFRDICREVVLRSGKLLWYKA
jgi:hypothetical protein